jgi:uncharacterized membrane protein required for colicin V production
VSGFDLVFAALAVLAVAGGVRLGFVTRVVSWVGLAVGLTVAVRVLPWVLDQLTDAGHALVVVVTLGILVIGASLGQAAGFLVGGRLRPRRPDGVLGTTDRVAGGLAGLVGLVAVIWLLLPVLLASRGWVAREATTSWVARTIDASLPPAPDAMQTLQALIGEDAFPRVFDALRPTPDLGPPPEASGLDVATAAATARSVVKIEGLACTQLQDGSGFVVDDELVVTNAHVVAGERRTIVVRDDGRRMDGTVVAFDPDRDLALVQVPGLDRPALPLADGPVDAGTVGGVFGHPGGEPLRIAPFRVERALTATGRDIYDGATTRREVLEVAASLRPGDSGSALVDPGGRVVGVAFAVARDRDGVAYALAVEELRAVLADRSPTAVPTGSCLA